MEHAKLLQEKFQVKKMTKSELKRIKNEAFQLLKDSSESAIEVEYHLENIARAMSNNIDWLNPEANIEFTRNDKAPYYTDWSKPLPTIGKPDQPKIPFRYFFNKDLEFLLHGSDLSKKYATSLTLPFPAAIYSNCIAIEEKATHLFSKSVEPYDRDAMYGIHHWPEL